MIAFARFFSRMLDRANRSAAGKPSVGLVFSQDFNSGLSDHFGVTEGFGLRLLKYWMVSNVIPAALQRTQSNVLAICVPTVFGINLYPPLFKNANHLALELDGAHSIVGFKNPPKRLPPGSLLCA